MYCNMYPYYTKYLNNFQLEAVYIIIDICIRILRHYDELGLLVPKSTDYYTSYSYYSEEQLLIASRITALMDMGFSLAAISEILKNYNNPKALSEFLTIKQAEVQSQAEEISLRLLLLETAIKRLRKDDNANYNVILKTLPKRYVASVRKIIPSYNQEGILCNLLLPLIKAAMIRLRQ